MATAAARAAASLLTRRGVRPQQQQLLGGLLQRRGLASLGESEVAISMLAAPVTKADLAGKSKGTEGVGLVTAVGSKVKAVGVNDWVVPAAGGAVGTFAPSVTAKEGDVAKVPSDIPVEYAANFHSALTAHKLLEGLGDGDVVVQADADSTVGLAVVQMAKAKGVVTVNIVADGAGFYDRAGLVKQLGGDVVVMDTYAASHANFPKILAELGKPKAAFTEGSPLPAAVAGVKAVTYGPGASLLAKASPAERAKAMEEVGAMFREGLLHVWVERHPFADMAAAVAEAKEPGKGRRVVLVMREAPKPGLGDLGQIQAEFEAAFQQLRA